MLDTSNTRNALDICLTYSKNLSAFWRFIKLRLNLNWEAKPICIFEKKIDWKKNKSCMIT